MWFGIHRILDLIAQRNTLPTFFDVKSNRSAKGLHELDTVSHITSLKASQAGCIYGDIFRMKI